MNVLFHSTSCQFCSDAVRRAIAVQQQQPPSSATVVLLSVDDPSNKAQLPAYVDRVPMLFTSDRRVLVGSAINDFLDALLDSPTSATGPMAIEGGSGFAWLENTEDASAAACLRTPFMSFGGLGQQQQQQHPQQHGNGGHAASPMVRQRELPPELRPLVISRGSRGNTNNSMDAVLASRDMELGGGRLAPGPPTRP